MRADSGFCSKFFSALANRLRVKMLQELSLKPMTVNQLVQLLGSERTLISHNLTMLAKSELVKFTKAGKTRVYSANQNIVPYVFFLLEKVVCSRCSIRRVCQALREKEIAPQIQINRPPCEACR